ncbi:MAG TPA: PspC domain-containing protein [Opitutales bacterium]|nr:PspC domain-containing protein [Opitutales bacterium]
MSRKHFTLYRSRNGKIFGVFQGIADATELDAYWMRVIAVIILFFSGIFPILILYIAAALLMKPEPLTPLEPEAEDFYNSMTSSRKLALMRLSSKMDALEKRTQFVENIVTSRGWDWDSRMNRS